MAQIIESLWGENMPFCSNCGSLVGDHTHFCDKCGTIISNKTLVDENIILRITWKEEVKKSVKFVVEINGIEIGEIKKGDTISANSKKGINKIRFIPNVPKWFGWKPLSLTLDIGQSPHITLAIGSMLGQMGGTWQLHVVDAVDAVILEQRHA